MSSTEHVTGDARDAERSGRFRHGLVRVRFGRVATLTKRERLDGERTLVHGIGVRLSVERRAPFGRDLRRGSPRNVAFSA